MIAWPERIERGSIKKEEQKIRKSELLSEPWKTVGCSCYHIRCFLPCASRTVAVRLVGVLVKT